MKKSNRGITLVEIAIVLVIIGLLLGGVLKGQELINNAKIRSIADRQNSLKAAWFAFIDRYAALPGDYIAASQYIPKVGNGEGDGELDVGDSALVFSHLTGAGYIRCSQCRATVTAAPTASNSLTNQYGGVMAVFHNATLYSYRASTAATSTNKALFIFSGNRLPSNIIGEVDRKIDDGIANEGDFTFSQFNAAGTAPAHGQCMTNSATAQASPSSVYGSEQFFWRHASASPAIFANCGAANRI